ncbi:outer membrane lipoprotein-sorting protein [Geothrix sp. PMB-07]|uniref:outer membrane lipoprotein-sorting protein n=1 Tax=Geothrix sp. PMB-07 TaxID=3068640 RepID=UPI0027408204|nr:outer membrane lipoprotein-sorting protein [Geothrix sp. PMB-07]WLT32137.1 outer membrane lipoprotein-sorting protein [Geothrix sp. PMB-07]
MRLDLRFAWLLPGLSLMAQSGEEILARVDRLRHPWPAFTVELSLKAGSTSQQWRVSARENGDARLDGLSPKEKGRSVLMKGDQMWLLVPGSKRPVKVTPQQRMMGPAAGGDVARTRFREDYTVTSLGEESLDGRDCWKLELAAKRPVTSARQVLLWVAREGSLPLRAEFRLASGKLARTASFGPPIQAQGQAVLSRMSLEEPGGATAELLFSHWAKGGVEASAFDLPNGDR